MTWGRIGSKNVIDSLLELESHFRKSCLFSLLIANIESIKDGIYKNNGHFVQFPLNRRHKIQK